MPAFNLKNPFASKTLWVNALTAIIAVVMALSGQEFITDNPLLTTAFIFLLAVLNAALRFVTDAPIGFKLIVLAIGLSLGGSVLADDVAVVFDGNKPGSYIVTVDGLGGITASPLSKVVRIGPSPTPQPPTPDPSPVLTDRAKAIRDVAMKATADPDRANTAKGLAVLYREVAKLVRQPGQVKDVTSLVTAVSTATNTFLVSRGPNIPAVWQPTRDQFGNQWTTLTAKGAPLTDYATLLDEAASGLDASAPAMRGISPEMLQFIMQIIQLILALLKPV